jgi:molybdate transport system regulatory protein
MPRKNHPPVLRARLWVEIDGQRTLTDAGADLLEQIEVCGSVSEAARRLRFAYRRAWLLIDGMNRNWPKPLVRKSIGGVKGGGTKLTPLGKAILAEYRHLQIRLEHLLDETTPVFTQTIDSTAG